MCRIWSRPFYVAPFFLGTLIIYDLEFNECHIYDYRVCFIFNAINDNLPEIIEKYGSNSRKITCDVYIDDRASHVDNY